MIPYSIVMRGNPQHEEDPKKAYATNQVVEVLPLEKFAEHISSHGSKYDEADITVAFRKHYGPNDIMKLLRYED